MDYLFLGMKGLGHEKSQYHLAEDKMQICGCADFEYVKG